MPLLPRQCQRCDKTFKNRSKACLCATCLRELGSADHGGRWAYETWKRQTGVVA